MSASPRVRFAPSPTGELHLGNARTALFNYLFARKEGGTLVLRIEDTDKERSRPEYERSLMEELRWLGIRWDEGPDCGGPFAPYRQSEALEIFSRHLKLLTEQGAAYPCFCTPEELEEERRMWERIGKPYRYSGKCRNLSREEQAQRIAAGIPHVYRLRFPPDEEEVVFHDLIRGAVRFQVEHLGGDLVLTRSDGTPTYQFAVVVDDHRMAITHVLRGEDHLTNTAKQLLLYRAFGWDPPRFGHFPMILGSDRSKLSKRHGALSLGEYRRMGILPEALFNDLALLGFSPGDNAEVLTPEELVVRFELRRVQKSPAVFDPRKLLWLNGMHLRKLPGERFCEEALAWMKEHEPSLFKGIPEETLRKILPLYHDGITHFGELPEKLKVYQDPQPGSHPDAREIEAMETFPAALELVGEALPALPPEGEERVAWLEGLIGELQKRTGARGKALYQPLRLILTGEPHGPDLKGVIRWIPRGVLAARLETFFKSRKP